MRQFWLVSVPSIVKCSSSEHKIFQSHSSSTAILAKRFLEKLIRFSESANYSSCTKLILYGYHFKTDLKIFRATDHGRDKSCEIAWAFDEEYWESDSLSTIANATSSTVSLEICFFNLPSITLHSPVFSNLVIIFFKTYLDIDPFRKLFKLSYS